MVSTSSVRNDMPTTFKSKYPFTRVILDATEIYVEKPSLPDVQQQTFSNYKTITLSKC